MSDLLREPKTYIHDLRVRYQETDQMGVVYHANYLNWFEIARTELIRNAGLAYRDLEASGLLLPVIEAQAKFIKPARYDDVVCIVTQITEFSHIKSSFAYSIYRWGQLGENSMQYDQSQLLVTGSTKHVWVDRNFKPIRLDKYAPEIFLTLQSLTGIDG